MLLRFTCPVCAYSLMPYPAAEGNICPCCGTEFGYDDTMGVTFRQIRDRWVANRTPWFSPVDERPQTWNGITQLILSDYEFTWPDWLPKNPAPQIVRASGTRVQVGFAAVA